VEKRTLDRFALFDLLPEVDRRGIYTLTDTLYPQAERRRPPSSPFPPS